MTDIGSLAGGLPGRPADAGGGVAGHVSQDATPPLSRVPVVPGFTPTEVALALHNRTLRDQIIGLGRLVVEQRRLIAKQQATLIGLDAGGGWN